MLIDSEQSDPSVRDRAPGPRPLRIYYGPVNVVNGGRHLADVQRELGHFADFIVYWEGPIEAGGADFNFRIKGERRFVQVWTRLCFFLICLARYRVFHFYAGHSLLPWNLDLPVLRLFRKKLVMTYCGSDVRQTSVEASRNPYWKLIDDPQNKPERDAGKIRMMRWHRLWVHRVTGSRNLYAHIRKVFPERQVVSHLFANNLLDLGRFPINEGTRDVPLIVHAPSQPRRKGTEYIEAVIDELTAEGYRFSYRRVEHLTQPEAFRVYTEEADIIIDQLLFGGVGSLCFEGMAAGKPVVGYLLEEVKGQFAPDIPLVNVTLDTLKERLIHLITHPDVRVELGRLGRAFAERHCDRQKTGRAMNELYLSL